MTEDLLCQEATTESVREMCFVKMQKASGGLLMLGEDTFIVRSPTGDVRLRRADLMVGHCPLGFRAVFIAPEGVVRVNYPIFRAKVMGTAAVIKMYKKGVTGKFIFGTDALEAEEYAAVAFPEFAPGLSSAWESEAEAGSASSCGASSEIPTDGSPAVTSDEDPDWAPRGGSRRRRGCCACRLRRSSAVCRRCRWKSERPGVTSRGNWPRMSRKNDGEHFGR